MERTKKSEIGIIIDSQISVYENRLLELLHDFMDKYGYSIDDIKNHFRHLIVYMSKQITIDRTKLKDIDYIISLFDIFVNLCDIVGYNPTFGIFLRVYNIKEKELKDILNNKYNNLIAYTNSICKSRIIDNLVNEKGNNRNLQFIAASVYGISEINAKRETIDKIVLTNKELAEQIGVIE